jgi:methylglutaconyl-CoA hydratase
MPAARKSVKRATRGAPKQYTALTLERRDAVAWIALNRPEVHNAFDETLIGELTDALAAADADADVRAIVLCATGRSFCAGADLNWMRRMAGYGKAENLADARALARLMSTLAGVSKPTVARVHGNAFGGGVGLVACCDIAVAAQEASFAFSEAKLGLIPATIGPYVVEAIGPRQARRYFVTGERFDAAEARRIGLVHEIVPAAAIDARMSEVVDALLQAGPNAQAEVKALVRAVAHRPIDAAVIEATARHIARVRASPEGREGIAAFLERRAAAWVPPPLPDDPGVTKQ